MDKRRYKSRSPRNPRDPITMDGDCCGKPAIDGFVSRHREPLNRDDIRRQRFGYSNEGVAGSLMDESEARYSKLWD